MKLKRILTREEEANLRDEDICHRADVIFERVLNGRRPYFVSEVSNHRWTNNYHLEELCSEWGRINV